MPVKSRGVILSNRRRSGGGGGGGGGTSFWTSTNWSRPTFTPTRTVGFATQTALTSAISNMQAGDYIYYNGSGVLTISNSNANVFTISNKNPSSEVVIDFGTLSTTGTTNWNAPTTGNYVKFMGTSTSVNNTLWINACSNLTIYGGEFTGSAQNFVHEGILVDGPANNLTIWDFVVHDIAGGGIFLAPISNSTISNCSVRGEVYNWCLSPTYDPHGDKGTGVHCCLAWDVSGGSFHDNVVAIYGHDSLAPGQVVAGTAWPEGGGGSCIEIGQSGSVGNGNNNTYYAYGKNFNMQPGNGTNPGSTQVQTGGNIINFWGGVPLNGNVIGWAEGYHITGAVIDASSGTWDQANPPVTVQHGRAYQCNLYTGGGNQSTSYPTGVNIVYNDCTVGTP